MQVTLEELNQMDQTAFVKRVGWIFEHSPWVAERAWYSRPFSSFADLHLAMENVVHHAAMKQKLALIRAHPDLASRVQMADASIKEQAGAGLQQLSEEEYEGFLTLNEVYTRKFGFPFIMAVRGQNKERIRAAIQERLGSEPKAEREEALQQVCKIARFRLEDLVHT